MIIRNKKGDETQIINLACDLFKEKSKHCRKPCWRIDSLYRDFEGKQIDSKLAAAIIIYSGIQRMEINNVDDAVEKGTGIFRYLGIEKDGGTKILNRYKNYSVEHLKKFIDGVKEESSTMFSKSLNSDSWDNDANTLFTAKIAFEWIPILLREINRLIDKGELNLAAEFMFHAGRLFERAKVLPFEFRTRSGALVKKGASYSGNKRSEGYRKKREGYRTEVEAYLKRNPSHSFSAACLHVANKHDVTSRTIMRYVKNPNIKK